MPKYLFEITLVVEAEDREEAKGIAEKIVNHDFPKEIAERIDQMGYEFVMEYVEEDP